MKHVVEEETITIIFDNPKKPPPLPYELNQTINLNINQACQFIANNIATEVL